MFKRIQFILKCTLYGVSGVRRQSLGSLMVMQRDEIWLDGFNFHYGEQDELYYMDTIYPGLRSPDSFFEVYVAI